MEQLVYEFYVSGHSTYSLWDNGRLICNYCKGACEGNMIIRDIAELDRAIEAMKLVKRITDMDKWSEMQDKVIERFFTDNSELIQQIDNLIKPI